MENWKRINSFDNYLISTLGRVKSIARLEIRKDSKPLPVKETILKQFVDIKGYAHVGMKRNDNKWQTKQVHRLVAEAFLPNPNNQPCVNHKDENKLNNCVDNLEWCTVNYNVNYGSRNHNVSKSLKNNPKISKTVLQFDTNGNLIKEWSSLNQIKRESNLNISRISLKCRGKVKQFGNYIWKYKE